MALELPSIGWLLFLPDSSPNDWIASCPTVVTFATRLLTEPLSKAVSSQDGSSRLEDLILDETLFHVPDAVIEEILLEGALSGFGPTLYVEYALLAMLFRLVASHGAYFGRRLVELAEARQEAGASEKAQVLALRRRRLQRLSFRISMLNILVSAAVLILAAYVRSG